MNLLGNVVNLKVATEPYKRNLQELKSFSVHVKISSLAHHKGLETVTRREVYVSYSIHKFLGRFGQISEIGTLL